MGMYGCMYCTSDFPGEIWQNFPPQFWGLFFLGGKNTHLNGPPKTKKINKSLPVPPPFPFSSSSSFSSLRCCVLFCSILLCCRWCWPLLVARHSSLSFAGKKLSGCRTFLLLFLLLLLLLLLPWLLLLLSRKLQLPLRSTGLQGFVWSSPL